MICELGEGPINGIVREDGSVYTTTANDLPTVPNYNVCPTNRVHAVVSGEGGRRLTAMRWLAWLE